jgi:hypothetical protein
MSDDEESFLVPAETENSQKNKTWCRINEKNELDYVDWEMVDGLAKQFDASKVSERSEQMLIGKLMWCVRQQTIKELKG